LNMTEMAETHVELNQFPVPRVGPRHSTHVRVTTRASNNVKRENVGC